MTPGKNESQRMLGVILNSSNRIVNCLYSRLPAAPVYKSRIPVPSPAGGGRQPRLLAYRRRHCRNSCARSAAEATELRPPLLSPPPTTMLLGSLAACRSPLKARLLCSLSAGKIQANQQRNQYLFHSRMWNWNLILHPWTLEKKGDSGFGERGGGNLGLETRFEISYYARNIR